MYDGKVAGECTASAIMAMGKVNVSQYHKERNIHLNGTILKRLARFLSTIITK
jgi:cytoskeletal protein CcmA (bactofilin family)